MLFREFVHEKERFFEHGRWFKFLGFVHCILKDQVTRCSSRDRLVLVLDFVFNIASLNLKEEMLTFKANKFIALLLVKVDS
jgi:hypothetical protein